MPPKTKSVSDLALELQSGEIDFRNATIQECTRTVLADWATSSKRTEPSKLHPLAPYMLDGVRKGLGLAPLAGGASKTMMATSNASTSKAPAATRKRAAPTTKPAEIASKAKKPKPDSKGGSSSSGVGPSQWYELGFYAPAPGIRPALDGWGPRSPPSAPKRGPKKEEEDGFYSDGWGL